MKNIGLQVEFGAWTFVSMFERTSDYQTLDSNSQMKGW